MNPALYGAVYASLRNIKPGRTPRAKQPGYWLEGQKIATPFGRVTIAVSDGDAAAFEHGGVRYLVATANNGRPRLFNDQGIASMLEGVQIKRRPGGFTFDRSRLHALHTRLRWYARGNALALKSLFS